MSDTPRTDATAWDAFGNLPTNHIEVVTAHFARGLERELTALKDSNRELLAALEKCCKDIEFWNEVLEKEWSNFDGQLNPALNQARAAISNATRKEGDEICAHITAPIAAAKEGA